LGTHPERFPEVFQEIFFQNRNIAANLARFTVEINNLVELMNEGRYDERVSAIDSACHHLMMVVAEFDRALS